MKTMDSGGLSIAVVDDSIEIATTMAHMLSVHGHQVEAVTDGRELLRRLAQRAFDLVITDVLMPECDGLELIMKLRQLAAPPRILVMTGGGRCCTAAEYVAIAKSLGADGALQKPFDFATLCAAMQALPGFESALEPAGRPRWASGVYSSTST